MKLFLLDADESLEALFAEIRQIHAAELQNEAYQKHLHGASMRLKRLRQQQCGVRVIMAMDSTLGLAFRRGRTIKV